ncbi:S-formylglutathione hydrolase [Lichenicola sp.]|uniref:S-formylglutathione hydrolase n=1 Tax=Lichenicola sp. TaxID=2804529 RepID=UPI003B0057A6
METRSTHRTVGGTIGFYTHRSEALGGLEARFGVFVPDGVDAAAPGPALYALGGLTSTEETFATKSGALRAAAQHRLVMVFPDTSPRGADIPGEDDDWDFGTGAGFYLDATQPPWSRNYRMGSYVNDELPALVEAEFPVSAGRRGVIGHSMGGHGALTLALRNPANWQSVSALAPICHPADVPWGQKAFPRYLGNDPAAWAAYDATLLLRAGHRHPTTILIDQGSDDQYLEQQLRPDSFEQAAIAGGQPLQLQRHPGYDHSYWFIQSVIDNHVEHHARILHAP